MAGFRLVKSNAEANDVEEWTVSSLTLAVGDLLEMDLGASTATVADSSTEHWLRKGVCQEAATSSDTLVTVVLVNPDQVWEVESANNSNATHNGDRMLLTDKNTVNNTGTDDASQEACVVQTAAVGVNTNKDILVKFFDSTGINPDAS